MSLLNKIRYTQPFCNSLYLFCKRLFLIGYNNKIKYNFSLERKDNGIL